MINYSPGMNSAEKRLADRLGIARHVSPLRMYALLLMKKYPLKDEGGLEDWLLETANQRGACLVMRAWTCSPEFTAPPLTVFSNAELVTSICLAQNLDRPHLLRVAAQLITRGDVDMVELLAAAPRERTQSVLAEMARQALTVQPEHTGWRKIFDAFKDAKILRAPVIHWTRISEPVPDARGVSGSRWRLAS